MAETKTATRDELLGRFVAMVSLTPKEIGLLQSLMALAYCEGEASGMRQISEQLNRSMNEKEDTTNVQSD